MAIQPKHNIREDFLVLIGIIGLVVIGGTLVMYQNAAMHVSNSQEISLQGNTQGTLGLTIIAPPDHDSDSQGHVNLEYRGKK